MRMNFPMSCSHSPTTITASVRHEISWTDTVTAGFFCVFTICYLGTLLPREIFLNMKKWLEFMINCWFKPKKKKQKLMKMTFSYDKIVQKYTHIPDNNNKIDKYADRISIVYRNESRTPIYARWPIYRLIDLLYGGERENVGNHHRKLWNVYLDEHWHRVLNFKEYLVSQNSSSLHQSSYENESQKRYMGLVDLLMVLSLSCGHKRDWSIQLKPYA